jgi:HYR domain
VTCTTTDAHHNTATGSFTVTVQDTTPPPQNTTPPPQNTTPPPLRWTCRGDITTQATSNSLANVTYTATATDLVDGSVPVSCSPASGTFPVGTTTVTCTTTDAHHNTATGSFTVTVQEVPGWSQTPGAGRHAEGTGAGKLLGRVRRSCQAVGELAEREQFLVSAWLTGLRSATRRAYAADVAAWLGWLAGRAGDWRAGGAEQAGARGPVGRHPARWRSGRIQRAPGLEQQRNGQWR